MAFTPSERNQDATIYVGDLDGRVTEEMLWELFVQVGPVVHVHLPKDKITNQLLGFGFVEFRTEEDAEYSVKVMNMIKVFERPIRVNRKLGDRRLLDVGANLFIGNVDPEVDEKLLFDTFSMFGNIVQAPKIMSDVETGNPKGYAFVHFDSFESSDAAIEAMNGQYLMNRQLSVQYAFKKDDQGRKTGERHGDQAERLLSAANPARGLPGRVMPAVVATQAPPVALAPPMGHAIPAPPMPSVPAPWHNTAAPPVTMAPPQPGAAYAPPPAQNGVAAAPPWTQPPLPGMNR